MYTFNHHYQDDTTLEAWLNKHAIAEQKGCLVQFFCGQPQENRMVHIASLLVKKLPLAHIMGSTTDGEIIENNVLIESIVISCSVFEKSSLRSAEELYGGDSYSMGKNICSKLDGDDIKVLILFTAGLDIDGEAFLNGVWSVSGGRYIVSGGMAGDNAQFVHTYVAHGESIIESGAVGIALCGSQLRAMNQYQFGWNAIGLPMEVTKAKGNRVYEIEHQSVVSIYEKYLSKPIADQLPKIGAEIPLIIERNGVKMARACLQKMEDDSLIFAGDIAVGEMVRFGVGDINVILEESKTLCKYTKSRFQPETIFVYSCMARRRLLQSSRPFELKNLANGCHVSGFYAYGEFFSDTKNTYLMNETLTLLALSESGTNSIQNKSESYEDEIPISSNLLAQALTYMTNVVTNEWEARLEEEIEKNREEERIDFQNSKLIQMGELVSMIAHQWRQPLNALSATAINMSLLSSMGKLEPEHVQDSSRFIQEQCQKMSQTIDTFINFVKPAKESRLFRLQHTIEAIMQIIGSRMASHSIDITTQQLDETLAAEGYEDLLEQVLLNILSNAKDAFENQEIPEKWLRITLYEKEDVPRIIIEDNAGGIPENAQKKIFNPYFTTKEQGKGTGIGLYMSINIMRKSFKGDLLYTPIPNGSRFELILGRPKEREV